MNHGMRPFLSPTDRRAAAARVEALMGAGAGPARAPVRDARPTPAARMVAADRARARNLARMAAWVEATRAAALAGPDPQAVLMDWCDWLGRRMSDLGGGDCGRHLHGLTAFDLGEAQIALLRPPTIAAAATEG
jgi:hypothetical protein